jgi:uncharacterized Ntn-hydrolase superfamily protein
MVEPAYGPRALDLMSDGLSAPEALRVLLAADDQEDARQVAVIDNAGRVAVHTGPGCIAHAGHTVGNQVSAQANIMARPTVPEAMLDAYTTAEGDLAERLLGALDAAEAEGGDLRGRQSAALLVVSARASGSPSQDTVMDLRVEDDADPLGELRRLVDLQYAYALVDAGDQLAAAGDVSGALREYAAAHGAQPDNAELAFWHGVALAAEGDEEGAAPLLRQAFEAHAGWGELLQRLPAAGLFPDDPQLIERLIGTRADSLPE